MYIVIDSIKEKKNSCYEEKIWQIPRYSLQLTLGGVLSCTCVSSTCTCTLYNVHVILCVRMHCKYTYMCIFTVYVPWWVSCAWAGWGWAGKRSLHLSWPWTTALRVSPPWSRPFCAAEEYCSGSQWRGSQGTYMYTCTWEGKKRGKYCHWNFCFSCFNYLFCRDVHMYMLHYNTQAACMYVEVQGFMSLLITHSALIRILVISFNQKRLNN